MENINNFSLEETQGRPWKLFLSPQDTAIAHCVSSDFQMDKGIAKQFLKQYGNFDELTQKGWNEHRASLTLLKFSVLLVFVHNCNRFVFFVFRFKFP